MPPDRSSTVRGRELGGALRVAVTESGLSGKAIAVKLDWSETKMSHILSGRRNVSEVDVAALLAVTGVVGDQREALLELCREASAEGWLWRRRSGVPGPLRTIAMNEADAKSVSEYQTMVVPGLIQTEDYARALLRASTRLSEEEIDAIVSARLVRQESLSRVNPPRFVFYIEEYALRRSGPGPVIMVDQLRRILRLSGRGHITVRVVPDLGFHTGTTGAFSLTEFHTSNPVVILENAISALFLERADEIQVYRDTLAELDAVALGGEETRVRIEQWVTDLL